MMEIDLSQQEEVVIIRGEEGHTRMVYMDGRDHPIRVVDVVRRNRRCASP